MTDWTENLFAENPGVFLPALETRVEDADEQVSAMLSLLEETYDHVPASVLDVACGIGRHVIPFAERGIEAHGLDISNEYLRKAEERAATVGVSDDVAFFEQDMRELGELDRTYELLINVYTSFGLFDEETNERVVRAFHDRLDQGGALLLELANKEGILATFDDDGVTIVGDRTFIEQREYDPLSSRVQTTLIALADESYLGEYELDLRLYAPVELRRLLEDAGFNDVGLFGSVDGEELARESTRMIVLGRKG